MNLIVIKVIRVPGGYIEHVNHYVHRCTLYYGYLDNGRVLGFHKSLEQMVARIERYIAKGSTEEEVVNEVVKDQVDYVPQQLICNSKST